MSKSSKKTQHTETGKTCKKCGATDRFPSGACRPCGRKSVTKYISENIEKVKVGLVRYRAENREKIKDYREKYRAENPEKCKAGAAKYRIENCEKENARHARWRAANPEKAKEACARWRKENPEKVRVMQKRANVKKRSTPHGCISLKMSNGIRKSLTRGTKNRQHWETLVGYTAEDLKIHLGKQFKDGMSWENIGDWHIDHIIPQSAFNYETASDIDFKRCWALNNLQPLWAKENLMKSNKLAKPFQPSLKI